MTVEQASLTTCSTQSVEGLCRQVIAEALDREPDLLAEVSHARIRPKYQHVYLMLQPYAAESLVRVVNRRKSAILRVASCLRVLPAQYLLYRYYRMGRCGIQLAAPPGASNHEKGNAVDVESPESWRWAFEAEGWRWLGSKDPPHFDKVSGRADVDNRMVAAFQRLWNANNPTRKIAEDGAFGAKTEAALKKSPAEGWTMEERPEKWVLYVNGYAQPQIPCVVLDGISHMGIKAYCEYADYADPIPDAKAKTISMSTKKVPDEDEDETDA